MPGLKLQMVLLPLYWEWFVRGKGKHRDTCGKAIAQVSLRGKWLRPGSRRHGDKNLDSGFGDPSLELPWLLSLCSLHILSFFLGCVFSFF